ncbi:MAG: hypothetical protein P8Y05_08295 [Deinococcales bacterium]
MARKRGSQRSKPATPRRAAAGRPADAPGETAKDRGSGGPRRVRTSPPCLRLLPADPRPWLLDSDEPSARWLTRLCLHDGAEADPAATRAAHHEILGDVGTQALLDRLPDWGPSGPEVSSHASPAFAPNLLALLADLGVAGGQDERIERLLDAMLEHQRPDGRFTSFGAYPRGAAGVWSALPCDTHAITEVLLRFGRSEDERVARAVARIRADLSDTSQGPGWRCLPDPSVGFRGPGRVSDVCPQATLEGLRVLARLQVPEHGPEVLSAVRTVLHVWRERGRERPYMFGHGRRFKTIKWPTFWYDVYAVLDTVGRYPQVWSGPSADPVDRRAVAELAACMLAYNVGDDGRVTPRSCYRGFERYSFGQKRRPSPFATARVLVVLRRFEDLVDAIAAADVESLTSSKGGRGVALPPR